MEGKDEFTTSDEKKDGTDGGDKSEASEVGTTVASDKSSDEASQTVTAQGAVGGDTAVVVARTDANESYIVANMEQLVSGDRNVTLSQANNGAGATGYLTAQASTASTSGRLGYFVIQFLKKQDGLTTIVEDPYIGSGGIPRAGLSSLTAFKEQRNQVEKTNLDNSLNRKLDSPIDAEMETGYYEVLPASIAASCSNTNTATCQYYGDRLFFAEGTKTSAATLAQLAATTNTYHYQGNPGSVNVDIEHRTGDTSGGFESTTQGTFSADINFGSSTVRNVNMDAETAAYALKVQGGGAVLNKDGSFQFSQSGNTFQVGNKVDVQAGQATATNGQVSGQTFGSQKVGGVFYIEREVSASDKWLSTGNFRGSRP